MLIVSVKVSVTELTVMLWCFFSGVDRKVFESVAIT